MLLSEQVRHVKDEKALIEDSTTYSNNNLAWGTLHDYGNITLSEDSLVIFAYTVKAYGIGGYLNSESANHRLVFDDGVTVRYASGFPIARDTTVDVVGVIWLPAGTHDVRVEAKTDYYDGNNYTGLKVSNMKVGKAKFPDLEHSPLEEYSAAISKTLTQRKLAVGTIKNGVLHAQVFAYTSGTVTNFENPGQNYTNGVRILVDGTQQAWTERHQDTYAGQYGAATAKLIIPLSAGTGHTVEIQKDNADTVVHVSIIFTPWILGSADLEPLTLDFPQGSTLYVVAEPLTSNPTKNVKIGKKRAISFGDTTDYYSLGSGTDILSHSYTFETVEVGECVLLVNGYGGCISIIGVDVR